MTIEQAFITPNRYSRPQIPLKKVTKIAVHYAGNAGSTARNTRDYFESLKGQIPDSTGKWWLNKDGTFRTYKGQKLAIRYVSSHFVVGLDGEVIQCIPTDEWSYCTNQANGYSISIETCHPDSTGKFNDITETSLAELCAYLCKQFDLDPEKDIIRHYDVTGKQCPLYWSPTKYTSEETANSRFSAFKARVRSLLENDSVCKTEKSFLVKVLDSELNIRKYPSLTAPVTGVITDGGVYTITASEYGGNILWGKLKSGAGWISLGSKYVRRIEGDKQ